MRLWQKYLLTLSWLLAASEAISLPVFTFYGNGCNATTGSVVQVEETVISVLQLSGEIKVIAISKIEAVGRYDVLENPFQEMRIPTSHAPYKVFSSTSDKPFYAYAISFFDELVLFLDFFGQVHVVENDEIVALERASDQAGKAYTPAKSKSVVLAPIGNKKNCAKTVSSALAPTRVLQDKLQIDSFVNKRKSGYRQLDALVERTSFYAEPVLFDQKNRMGIVAQRKSYSELLKLPPSGFGNLPIYFETGNGAPYRFQGRFSIGTKSWRSVPSVHPFAAVQSEFKSHLIHGLLVANLDGIGAGKPLFNQSWSSARGDGKQKKEIWFISSINHMTLLGADYKSYMVSFGSFFPVIAVGNDREFREVLGRNAGLVGRLGYRARPFSVELLYFSARSNDEVGGDQNEKERSGNHTLDGSSVLKWNSDNFMPQKIRSNFQASRLNLQYRIGDQYRLNLDLLYATAKISENALLRDRPIGDVSATEEVTGTPVTNKVNNDSISSRVAGRVDLGKWVALKAEVYLVQSKTSGRLNDDGSDRGNSDTLMAISYLGAFELLL